MVCSSFNVQYQRTGIGPFSSLGKIGPIPIRSVRTGWFIIQHGIFPDDGHVFFFRISNTLSIIMVCSSSFNIQYQRTGIGPWSSLDEIGPRGSVCTGCIIKQHVAFTV